MAKTVGLLCDELWLMREELRKENIVGSDVLARHAATHSVLPINISTEMFFTAELSSTYTAFNEAGLRYMTVEEFRHLLIQCFNFSKFISYECNQEAA